LKRCKNEVSRMKISDRFNRLYHSLLNEAFTKSRQLVFRQWIDNRTGGFLTFYRGEDYADMDDLKQILKLMNIDYDVDGEEKISTVDVGNKKLCSHIDWITKILNENGIQFDHDILEWERLKKQAGIYEND